MSFDNDKPMSEEIVNDGSIYRSGGAVRIQKQMGLGDVVAKNPVPVFLHHVTRQDQYMFAVIQGLLVNGSYEEYSIGQIKDGIMDNFCQKAAVIARKLMEAADEEFK